MCRIQRERLHWRDHTASQTLIGLRAHAGTYSNRRILLLMIICAFWTRNYLALLLTDSRKQQSPLLRGTSANPLPARLTESFPSSSAIPEKGYFLNRGIWDKSRPAPQRHTCLYKVTISCKYWHTWMHSYTSSWNRILQNPKASWFVALQPVSYWTLVQRTRASAKLLAQLSLIHSQTLFINCSPQQHKSCQTP